jgi:HAD superfamily hydrolase (TIGR01459 family)
VHDGEKLYPGALEVFQFLKAQNKRVVLISNAPRRSFEAAASLDRMGLPRDLYESIITSGEVTHIALRDRPTDWLEALGKRCFVISRERNQTTYEGLDLQLVDTPAEADFVLATGTASYSDTAEQYEPVLKECRTANLTMVCANPDIEVFHAGSYAVCAGRFAEMYKALGGTVYYFGKPHPDIYRAALENISVPATRILMIGDGINTDIKGANTLGIDTLYILGGIPQRQLRQNWGAEPIRELFEQLIASAGCTPTYAAAKLGV